MLRFDSWESRGRAVIDNKRVFDNSKTRSMGINNNIVLNEQDCGGDGFAAQERE